MKTARGLWAFASVVVRTIFRDRMALFFIIVFPVVVIVIIGSTFGGERGVPIGVALLDASPLAREVRGELQAEDGVSVRTYGSADAVRTALRREVITTGVIVPAGLDATVAAGRPATVVVVSEPTSEIALTARLIVQGALGRVASRIGAAQVVTQELGGDFEENLALVPASNRQRAVGVVVEDVGRSRVRDLSRFSLTAPQNLVLFVFINALTSGTFLVTIRRAGVLRRSRATPTAVGTVLAGLSLGWFVFALMQSAIILTIGALLFGVRWGDPLAAGALVVVFAVVGTGAGLLVGAIGRNEDRVSAITPVVGIVLGALGGCMVPLDVFPETMRTVARAVPHFWAMRAWQALVFEGRGIGAIGTNLAVLAIFGATMLTAATLLLRRQLARG